MANLKDLVLILILTLYGLVVRISSFKFVVLINSSPVSIIS